MTDVSIGTGDPSARRRKWLIDVGLAAGVASLLWLLYQPGNALALPRSDLRWTMILLLLFACVLVGLRFARVVTSWATRRDRTLREAGLVSMGAGVIAALFALTLWLAILSVFISPIGLIAGVKTLRAEFRGEEGHSLTNLVGLVLNLFALGIVASQVLTAPVWR